jgi:hypothetical protein
MSSLLLFLTGCGFKCIINPQKKWSCCQSSNVWSIFALLFITFLCHKARCVRNHSVSSFKIPYHLFRFIVCDARPCNVTDRYKLFDGTCCSIFTVGLFWTWRQQVRLERLHFICEPTVSRPGEFWYSSLSELCISLRTYCVLFQVRCRCYFRILVLFFFYFGTFAKKRFEGDLLNFPCLSVRPPTTHIHEFIFVDESAKICRRD